MAQADSGRYSSVAAAAEVSEEAAEVSAVLVGGCREEGERAEDGRILILLLL